MNHLSLPNLTILTLDKQGLQDFAKERNQLLKNASTDWVLFLDRDETLSESLISEIKILLSDTPKSLAYKLKRQDFFLGHKLKYGETAHISLVRLARRNWGTWQSRVHERWIGPGPIGQLNSPILHYPHPSLSSFLNKIDHYSTLAAEERYEQKIIAPLWKIIIYPLGKFIVNYFLKLGFLDGVAGTIHAFMMSWHSYLTHAKLFLLWQKK